MKKVEIKCTGSDFASIDDFHPLQGNLKTLSDENYEKLKAQILTYGFSEPVASWERDNKKYIISGHQRIATLKRMRDEGYECPYIPYVIVEAADEHEAKMKVLSMASQYGKINPAGLKSFAEELELDIEDIDHDFSLPDIDLPSLAESDNDGTEVEVSAHTRTIGVTQEDEEAAKIQVQAEGRVKPGELWILGKHRLLCGDSTQVGDLEKLCPTSKADMLFTDPPYGVDYDGGSKVREKLANDDSDAIYRKFLPLVPKVVDGPCYTWFADRLGLGLLETILAIGGQVHATVVWSKNQATFNMNSHYKHKHEPCLYWKPKGSTLRWAGPTTECTVWEEKRDGRNDLHPTQKPVALALRAIQNHDVNTVMDLFAGSGSTLIAAEQLKKKCYAMELNPHYCSVILERWEKLTGEKAKLA